MATSLTQRIVNPNITTSPIVITTPDKEIKGPETMLAATWHGAKDVRADVQPRPHVTDPTDAVVRITTTTICGSDLHLYLNQVPALKPMEKGDILGHEGVGIVEEVGPNVTKFRRGDRVIVSAVIACGQCEYCRKGQFSVCDTTNPSSQAERMMGHRTAALFGYSHITGGFGGLQAEFARVPIADVNLLHLPASVPDEIGVLLSDVACTGWHANELGEVSAGQTVAIWGAGPIGLMAARWAKFRGAQTVISIDNVPQRLQQARTISGVDHTINFDEVSVTERIKELVPGGPDVCIDCAGFRFPKTFLHRVQTLFKLESDALDIVTEMIYAVKKAGKLVLIGDYFGFGNQFPIGAFMEKGCTMRGGQLFCQRYWEKLLEFVTSGQIDLSPFVTSTMTLDQIDEGYKRMIDYDQAVIKLAIKTNAAAPAAQPVQSQPVDLKAAFK